MLKLLLLALINIIVFTSCADVTTKNVTEIDKATATAEASAGSSRSKASASASAKSTVIETTIVSKNGSSSGSGSSNNKTCGEYNDNFDCSGPQLLAVTRAIFKMSFQYLCYMLESNSSMELASPLSTWYLMGIMGNYSYGQTQREILDFLGLKTREEIGCIMKLINGFSKNQPKGVKYYYSSNMLGDQTYSISKTFRQSLIFYVEGRAINNYNFTDSEETATKVNKLIYKSTHKKIQNIISFPIASKLFNRLSSLVFAAGVFFRAPWKKAFNSNKTTMGNYTNEQNCVIQVPYLDQKAIYPYIKSCKLKAQMLEIPYVGNFTLLFILPNSVSGLHSLVKTLAKNPELIEEDYKRMKEKCVHFYAPVFSNYSVTSDTVAFLNSTGEVNSILNEKTSQTRDYCGRTSTRFISGGIQKVRINNVLSGAEPYVDECSKNTKNMKPIEFRATHPGCFLILNNGIPIICGVSNNVIA